MTIFKNIAVYGGGSWGCALAAQVAKKQKRVKLFLRDISIINEILETGTNQKYLGNIKLPGNIHPNNDFSKLVESDVIIIATPSSHFTDAMNLLRQISITPESVILIATKGLCSNPTELMSERLKAILPNKSAFIAGPNFAKEVIEDLKTTATIASDNIELAKILANSIASENFSISTIDDIITLQIAGIIKNIIAIQSGIYDGKGYKENAKAALITDGLQEILTISQKLGGRIETILEPGVVGDMVLTCYSKTSRNTKFGYEYIKSENKEDFLDNYPSLVEGREAARLIMDLIKNHKLELPIISSVASILTRV